MARAQVSGTVKLAETARTMIESGRNVIELGEGEPDFSTPAHIIEAAHRAALAGQTRYTSVAGTPALREAVAAKFRTENGIDCDAGRVIVGTGAKQLIFNALLATLDPGDEVIIPAPYWVSYPDMVKIADGTPVTVSCTAETGFKMRPGQLASVISERTRWVILNSPGNPTGAVYSSDELEGLAGVLRRYPDVALMSDEIYEEIVFDGAEFGSPAGVAPDLGDRILTVNGVSKSFAMTGWRIGYATGPADIIAAMTKLQGQSTTNASSIGQAAALEALTGPREFLNDWRQVYTRRRELVIHGLSGIEGLGFARPAGAFYLFLDCGGLLGRKAPDGTLLTDDYAVSRYFLETAGVALVPGSEFGSPGYLRLCFAKSDKDLVEACTRIRAACAAPA